VTATEEAASSDCGPHGTIDGDECDCNVGFFGDVCDVQPTVLISNAVAITATVQTGSWTYFLITDNATAFTGTCLLFFLRNTPHNVFS
jgi:hypothetical protein